MKKQFIIYIVVFFILSTLSLNILAKSTDWFKFKDKDYIVEDNRIEVTPTQGSDFSQIKEANKKDMVAGTITYEGKEFKVEYVKNQLLFFSKDGVSFDAVKEMLKKHDGVIVGYMSNVDNYQVEFLNCTVNDLENKIIALQKESILESDTILLNFVSEYSINKTKSSPSVIESN